MRLLNFKLFRTTGEVVISAIGLKFDLHNLAEYEGMTVGIDGTVKLKWIVLQNPHRPDDCLFTGCTLTFRGMRLLNVGGRDIDMPSSEDKTLHGIYHVLPGDFKPYLKSKKTKEWLMDDPFHLLFEFRGGLSIEIDAEESEFQAQK